MFLSQYFRMTVLIGFGNSVMSFVGCEYGLEKNTLEEDEEGDADETNDA